MKINGFEEAFYYEEALKVNKVVIITDFTKTYRFETVSEDEELEEATCVSKSIYEALVEGLKIKGFKEEN